MSMDLRVEHLPERTVAYVHHRGPVETVDATRRPLYQHLIMNELIGGPSILRYVDPPQGDRVVDALVTTHQGYPGDEVAQVEVLPGGRYLIHDFEGPPETVPEAVARFRAEADRRGAQGSVLQVHLMDPIDGNLEAELQAYLGS